MNSLLFLKQVFNVQNININMNYHYSVLEWKNTEVIHPFCRHRC